MEIAGTLQSVEISHYLLKPILSHTFQKPHLTIQLIISNYSSEICPSNLNSLKKYQALDLNVQDTIYFYGTGLKFNVFDEEKFQTLRILAQHLEVIVLGYENNIIITGLFMKKNVDDIIIREPGFEFVAATIKARYGESCQYSRRIPDIILTDNCVDIGSIANLRAKLFDFQKDTVSWMLMRETQPQGLDHYIQLIDGWYFDMQTGYCSCRKSIESTISCKGGLLADEMGLGKTVMVLALILLNPYIPPTTLSTKHAHVLNVKMIEFVKSTLIVIPKSLLKQWKEEVRKHTTNLSFYHYQGKNSLHEEEREESFDFGKFDMVFTSYDVLGKDLHSAKPGREGPRRKNRKIQRRVCPLMSVLWHRIVLDEAQMVEATTSQPAELASLLLRTYSWGWFVRYIIILLTISSSSGTPCPKTGTVDDMKGIFKFMKCNFYEWKFINYLPDIELANLLGPIVHKNTKRNCASEVNVTFKSILIFLLIISLRCQT